MRVRDERQRGRVDGDVHEDGVERRVRGGAASEAIQANGYSELGVIASGFIGADFSRGVYGKVLFQRLSHASKIIFQSAGVAEMKFMCL